VEARRTSTIVRREFIAVALAVALFLGLVLHEFLLNPTWIGDDGDDGAYFLMSRNVWHYGAPLLDQSGSAHWSSSWSPGLSILLAPFGALPTAPSVVAERIVVMLTGVVFLVLSYAWRESRRFHFPQGSPALAHDRKPIDSKVKERYAFLVGFGLRGAEW
jgi:hypothetical protein